MCKTRSPHCLPGNACGRIAREPPDASANGDAHAKHEQVIAAKLLPQISSQQGLREAVRRARWTPCTPGSRASTSRRRHNPRTRGSRLPHLIELILQVSLAKTNTIEYLWELEDAGPVVAQQLFPIHGGHRSRNLHRRPSGRHACTNAGTGPQTAQQPNGRRLCKV